MYTYGYKGYVGVNLVAFTFVVTFRDEICVKLVTGRKDVNKLVDAHSYVLCVHVIVHQKDVMARMGRNTHNKPEKGEDDRDKVEIGGEEIALVVVADQIVLLQCAIPKGEDHAEEDTLP